MLEHCDAALVQTQGDYRATPYTTGPASMDLTSNLPWSTPLNLTVSSSAFPPNRSPPKEANPVETGLPGCHDGNRWARAGRGANDSRKGFHHPMAAAWLEWIHSLGGLNVVEDGIAATKTATSET